MAIGERTEYSGLITSHSKGEDFWALAIGGYIVREGIGEVPEDVLEAEKKELAKNDLLYEELEIDSE